jgi:putative ABC transport system permease protein
MGEDITGFPLAFEVRTSSPASLAPMIRAAVGELDPRLPVLVEPLTSRLKRTVVRERLLAWLSTILAALAFSITAIGLYGLVAFRLRRRTREFGLRMALGASPTMPFVASMTDGLGLLAVGLPAGLVLGYLASQSLSTLLFGLSGADPATYAGVAVLITLTTLAAAWLSARRLKAADPAAWLRKESE